MNRPHRIHPRPYQQECVDTIWNYYQNGGTGNTVSALPTGTGKSLIPPLFIQRAFQHYPSTRIVMLTHVKELVEQNRKALLKVFPCAPVGIYSAGLGKKEPGAPIVYGSIQSVKNAVHKLGRRDMMFHDECHLMSPKENTMFQTVVQELRKENPQMPIHGLSATPFRMGQGLLTDPTFDADGNQRKAIFDKIIFDITGIRAFNRLIEERYLSPLVPKQTDIVIDVSDVRMLGGEFNRSELASAVKSQNITGKALAQAYQLLQDRKSWIVFGAGIENCENIAAILNAMGVPTCYVHSKMPSEKRDKYIASFKAGLFRAIVSNNILTTGFDHPQIDAIIDLRPTVSVVMHLQKYGRGTRPYFHPSYSFQQLMLLQNRIDAMAIGGKPNCKVLDYAGNTARLGPINDPCVPNPKKKPGTGEVPVKICPECGTYNHTPARFCCDPDCKYEFIFKSKLKPNASSVELIRKNDTTSIEILDVTAMQALRFPGKNGGPDKVRVMYFSGIQSFTKWLGFGEGHKGWFKHLSHEWWRQHSAGEPPQSTAEALERFSECRQTKQIKVDTSKKWPDILECLF